MVLEERDSRARGLHFGRLINDLGIVLDARFDCFVHSRDRAVTKCETDNETERHLTGNFYPAIKSFFVLAEGLDIIIRKA